MSDFPLGGVFTEDDPYYLNQKDLARGYETFAQKHHLVREITINDTSCLSFRWG